MVSPFKQNLPLAEQTRKNYLVLLETHAIHELNTIPIGFNNNIIWNIAHIVATMDILYYTLNGLSPKLDNQFIDDYRKGTAPKAWVDMAFVEEIKSKLIDQLDWINRDLEMGLIPTHPPKPYMTSYKFELKSLEDIISFNQVHEALHMGIVMSLRKFI